MNWHGLSIEETFEILHSRQQLLSTPDAAVQMVQYGPGELQEGRKKSIADLLIGATQRCDDSNFSGGSNFFCKIFRSAGTL